MSTTALYIDEYANVALVDLTSEISTLRALQRLVDGLVDCVAFTDTVSGVSGDCWVNDEGLYRQDFGINLIATVMTQRQLVGPVVICNHDNNGETTGITDSQLDALRASGLGFDGGTPCTVSEIVTMRAQMAVA